MARGNQMRAWMLVAAVVLGAVGCGSSSGAGGAEDAGADAGPGPNVLTGSLAFPVVTAVAYVSTTDGTHVVLTNLTKAQVVQGDSATIQASNWLAINLADQAHPACGLPYQPQPQVGVLCTVTEVTLGATCITGHVAAATPSGNQSLEGDFAAGVDGTAGCAP